MKMCFSFLFFLHRIAQVSLLELIYVFISDNCTTEKAQGTKEKKFKLFYPY